MNVWKSDSIDGLQEINSVLVSCPGQSITDTYRKPYPPSDVNRLMSAKVTRSSLFR